MAPQANREKRRLRGSMVALVTPFRDGGVDYAALDRLVDLQLEAGTDALVPCGTTGESPTLTGEEHDRVIGAVIARCDGRCPVVAGTGSNSTAEAIRRTRQAGAAGADAALIVAPYYNRPTQEGLYRHYAAIAEATEIPIILYNVPKRTGVAIAEETVIRLRKDFEHIVAVKHATGSVDGVDRMLRGCDIDVLSGDDALTWPLMAMGAVGVISVVANIDPKGMRRLTEAALAGNVSVAIDAHRRVCAVAETLGGFGPNPIPIKTALALKGLCAEEFRLPLCPMEEEAKRQLADALGKHELL
ncbi:MAG TPA: 4-hydroxy-tetrahydrodipicolinate synthase [Phycisphaerae bacterium]|nr:4-hydroxy-tetrahydrodipicolinate synthase [Phycisphaerae bacterium]